MDANAVTRARSKAEEVRASLQRQQLLAVERRLQRLQDGTAPATETASSGAAAAVAVHEKPPATTSPAAPVKQSGSSLTGPAVEMVRATSLLQGRSEEGGTSAPAAGPSVTFAAAPQVVDRSAASSASSPAPRKDAPKTAGAPAVSAPAPPTAERPQRDVGPGVASTASASITQQVLSASASSGSGTAAGPRYLRYRDSLKRVSLSVPDRDEVQSALQAKEQFDQVEGDAELKDQLGSYLEKSVSGAAAAVAAPLPPGAPESDGPMDHRAETRYVKSDPSKSNKELSVLAALASAAAAKRLSDEEKEEHDAIAPEALMDAENFQRYTEGPSSSEKEIPAPTPTLPGSKYPQESSMSKSAAANRVVSFDLDPDDTETTRDRKEDMSESEASYHGTLTLKEYRRRRALQFGVLVLFLVVLPLAIGLGVAFSNRSAPDSPPSNSTKAEVSSLGPTGAPTPSFLRPGAAPTSVPAPPPGAAPTPVPAPPTLAPAAVTPQVISFPPMTSILDLLSFNDTGVSRNGG